jgi:hypothetical protein
MFIYLNKKIAIPNGIKLRCCQWNQEQAKQLLSQDKLTKRCPIQNSAEGLVHPARRGE